MPDPNDTLRTIQMLCADVAKSKTGLGYNADLMRRVGTWVFGSLDAVRDAIQAPDGQTWRAGMFAEAERRGKMEDWATDEQQKRERVEDQRTEERAENERLRAALDGMVKCFDPAALTNPPESAFVRSKLEAGRAALAYQQSQPEKS